jgi:nicotinamidase-related amidase
MDCGEGQNDFALWREYIRLIQAAGWGSLVDSADKKVGANDCLVVVDMQNDFVPVDSVNPQGGAFGVSEGAQTAPLIVQLMEHFAAAGGLVVCTRDYHPVGHCSWLENGGPFPRHCVQGTVGSHFYKPIGDTLDKLRQLDRRAEVVFKGYHEDVDSFGAFQYDADYAKERGIQAHDPDPDHLYGCSLCDWTGSILLKCSALDIDVNAPPDVMSVLGRKSLKDLLAEGGINRIFVCGLALDYCVLDSCLNAAKHKCGEVFMILDAARAAHISHVGSVGSGFLNDPAGILKQMQAASVKLVPTAALVPASRTPSGLPCNPDPLSHAMLGKEFPETLGPFALVKVGDVGVSVDVQKLTWSAVEPKKGSQVLKRFLQEPSGPTSALSQVTLSGKARKRLEISQSAASYMWAYPISAQGMTDQQRGYFALTTPEAAFFIFGGFIYLDKAGNVTDVKALALGKGLNFEPPKKWTDSPAFTTHINWQPVTAPLLRAKGARTFTWISPKDGLSMAGRDWKGLEHGAFVYRFSEDGASATDRDVYFAVSPVPKDEDMVAHGRSGIVSPPSPASTTKVQPAPRKQAWDTKDKQSKPKAPGNSRACLVQ